MKTNRIISLFILATLLLTMMPITAFAENSRPPLECIEYSNGEAMIVGRGNYKFTNQSFIEEINKFTNEQLNKSTLFTLFNIDHEPIDTLTDISYAFERMPNLRIVRVQDYAIQHLNGIENLDKLDTIEIMKTALSDISAIANLQHDIRTVLLDNNNISDVSGFVNKKFKINSLYLGGNNITDPSPLFSNLTSKTRYGYLSLYGNNISNLDFFDVACYCDELNIGNNPLIKYDDQLKTTKIYTINNLIYLPYSDLTDSDVEVQAKGLKTMYCQDTFIDNDNKTITINSNEGASSIVLYNFFEDVNYQLPQNDNISLYTTYRYKIIKPDDENTIITTLTVEDPSRVLLDGYYTLIVNFVEPTINLSASEFRMLYTPETPIVDNDAGTITLSAKEGLDYLAIYNVGVTKGVTFGISEDDCVEQYSTYRYKITKPQGSNQYTSKITVTTKDGTREYDLIVNFSSKDITLAQSEIQTVYTPETPIVDNTAKTITLTSKAGLDYLALYNVGSTNGVTFTIAEDDCVDHYSTYRYKITKPVDSNVYTSKITVTTKDGSAVYDLIVNFI